MGTNRMFEKFLASIPKCRSEMVNELRPPDDLTTAAHVWRAPDEDLSPDSPDSTCLRERGASTPSSGRSLSLSRAMTDSEIDYEMYHRYKNRNLSDPWLQLRAVLDSFPPDYLAAANSFRSSSGPFEETNAAPDTVSTDRPRGLEELRLKMERSFREECSVFTPDDPSLLAMKDALQRFDLNDTNSEISSA